MVTNNRLSVKDAAVLMEADQQFIRIAMQRGHLPIGIALKKSSQYTYYISKQRFAEYTGISMEDIDAYLNKQGA